jgi:hypothetical protein
MQFVDSILYIESEDFRSAGWKEDTIKKANSRESYNWVTITNPANKRQRLVKYDALTQEHKDKLTLFFKDPYEYAAKLPIKKLVIKDPKAEEFYRNYRFNETTPLPIERQRDYTTAASWLNFLLDIRQDRTIITKTLGISSPIFFQNVETIIKTNSICLPGSYRKLQAKIVEYQANGYECLIHGNYCNKAAAKIGKTVEGFDEDIANKQTSLIRAIASKHQNFNASQIARHLKPVFEAYNWKMIGTRRLRMILHGMKHITISGSRGTHAHDNTFAKHIRRKKPPYPLFFWTIDGWTVEMYYQDETGYTNRLTMVVVLDPFNDYPIGFAIGDRENTDLIKQSLRNALLHVKELFGDVYRPWQLQSDRYGIKQLKPFYENVGHLATPARVGNAKAKPVESFFNRFNETYCKPKLSWSGHNITARAENQPNREYLNKIKTSFPTRAEVVNHLELSMRHLRETKKTTYLDKWNKALPADKVLMNKENELEVLGLTTGYTYNIGPNGIVLTIAGNTISFDSDDLALRKLLHFKWIPYYDPENLSKILAVSEDKKHKFLLSETLRVSMDIKSLTKKEREYLYQVQQYNKEQKLDVVKTREQDAEVVKELLGPLQLNDMQEAALKGMFTYENGQQKEAIQDAKGLKNLKAKQEREDAKSIKEQEKHFNDLRMAYINSRVDFSKYE